MAFDEKLADRVRKILSVAQKKVTEKKMFGGLCCMVNDKMLLGVESERLMVRFDPAKNEELMEMEGCHPMDFTGRVMKGYAFVDKNVLNTKKRLSFWLDLALEYNKVAKPSKKKSGK